MLRDLQKFWKAFVSRETMACCYQLLYTMVIQNGLEIPALMRGTPCPAGFPVGEDVAGAVQQPRAVVPVQLFRACPALPALVQVQSLDVSSQPLSSQGAKGKSWGAPGVSTLVLASCFPMHL